MSQLRFTDVFNMARESGSNAQATKDIQPKEKAVSSVQRLINAQESQKQFIRVFKSTGRHLPRWEVFKDFLSLVASELDVAKVRTPKSTERCRKICERYDADDIANMHELFKLMVCVLDKKFHDFQGAIFMELELGDNYQRACRPCPSPQLSAPLNISLGSGNGLETDVLTLRNTILQRRPCANTIHTFV